MFQKRILALTGGLVEVVYPSGTVSYADVRVQLIHETVKTYLQQSHWPEVLGSADDNYYRSPRLISDICISYLQQWLVTVKVGVPHPWRTYKKKRGIFITNSNFILMQHDMSLTTYHCWSQSVPRHHFHCYTGTWKICSICIGLVHWKTRSWEASSFAIYYHYIKLSDPNPFHPHSLFFIS